MQDIMASFREGLSTIGGLPVEKLLDYSSGIDGLPPSDVLKFLLSGGCSVVVRPSGTEPKLKLYISVTAPDAPTATTLENQIISELEQKLV